VLSQARLIGLYPVSLVPLFVGPPLGILAHVYSLRNLAVISSSAVAGSPDPFVGAVEPWKTLAERRDSAG
jgi:hypothetical protein